MRVLHHQEISMKFKLPRLSSVTKKIKTQCGFTLIELIIALAVIGIGVGGVLVYQTSAENRQRVVGASQGLSSLIGKTKAAWLPQGSYAGLTAQAMGQAGFVEPPFRIEGAQLRDPWANNMGVTNGSLNNRWFGLTITPPNADTCTALASALAGISDRMTIGAAAPAWAAAGATIALFHPVAGGGQVVKAGPGAVINTANVTAGCAVAPRVIAMSFQ
jgi:prepilin-type N-terminal cleavage/methylation domain-containing protein